MNGKPVERPSEYILVPFAQQRHKDQSHGFRPISPRPEYFLGPFFTIKHHGSQIRVPHRVALTSKMIERFPLLRPRSWSCWSIESPLKCLRLRRPPHTCLPYVTEFEICKAVCSTAPSSLYCPIVHLPMSQLFSDFKPHIPPPCHDVQSWSAG